MTRTLLVWLHLTRAALLGAAALLTPAIGWASERQARIPPMGSGERRKHVRAAGAVGSRGQRWA